MTLPIHSIQKIALVGADKDGSKFDLWHWHLPKKHSSGHPLSPPLDVWRLAGFAQSSQISLDYINLNSGRDFLAEDSAHYDAVVLFNIFNGRNALGGRALNLSPYHSVDRWQARIAAVRPKILLTLHRYQTAKDASEAAELMPRHFMGMPEYSAVPFTPEQTIHVNFVRLDCLPYCAAYADPTTYAGQQMILAAQRHAGGR